MADREKLIELLEKLEKEGALVTMGNGYVANLMIANGVTLATDNHVGDKWVSTAERLPEEEGWYLVYTTPKRAHKSINKAMFCKGYEWCDPEPYWRGAGGHWANVTHWMPLPEPPKGE